MIGAFVAVGIIVSFLYGWAVVPLVVAAGLLVSVWRESSRLPALLIVLGVVLGALRGEVSLDFSLDPDWQGGNALTGQIASAAVNHGQEQRFIVQLDNDLRLCARSFSRVPLGRGDHVRIDIAPDSPASVSDGYAAYLRSKRCEWSGTASGMTILQRGSGSLRFLDGARNAIASRLTNWVPGDRGALLAGLVVGDESLMSTETLDAFERTGTIHVVAISGSNLTLLASLLLVAFAWTSRRRVTDVLALSVIWAYVFVGGAGPPTVRAGMLATAAAGARWLGRPADLLTLSLQVAAIQALVLPASVLGLSYRLSTAAIFGVLLASNGRSFRGVLGAVKLVLLTTLVVNLLLLPILPSGSRPSIFLSLIANTLIAPLISAAFVLGLLALVVGALIPVAGEALAVLAGEINGATIAIVQWIAGWDWLPGALRWDGSNTPELVLFAAVVVTLLAISTEFRRSVRDVRMRLFEADESTGMLVLGSGVGACLAVVAAALFR